MRKFGRVTGLTPSTARIRLDTERIPDSACGNLARAGSADCPGGCPGCGASGGIEKGVELDLPCAPASALTVGDRVSIDFLPVQTAISVLLGLLLPATAALCLGFLLSVQGFSGARGLAFLLSLALFAFLAWLYAIARRRFGFLPGFRIRIVD